MRHVVTILVFMCVSVRAGVRVSIVGLYTMPQRNSDLTESKATVRPSTGMHRLAKKAGCLNPV